MIKYSIPFSILRFIFFIVLFVPITLLGSDEVMTFKIISIPETTSDTARIYLASSLNNWEVADENFELTRDREGYYSIQVPKSKKPFQYKFTRGNWGTVEANGDGSLKSNRWYDPENEEIIAVEIASWQDHAESYFKRIRLVVTEIPDETPYDATLFVVGGFNNWKPDDLESKLILHSDGYYYLTLPPGLTSFDYKITRGTWESVEGRENGRAIPNRHFDVEVDGFKKFIRVSTWEDLSGSATTPYMFLLLLGAFQGLLLIFSIFGIQENNRRANVILALMILFTSIALMARVAMYYREIFQLFPKIYLIPELLLFVYGPLFYTYIKQLTESEIHTKDFFVRLIPFGIQLLIYIPLFALSNTEFEHGVLNQHYSWIFQLIVGIGLVFNAYYWWVCKNVLNFQNEHSINILSEERSISYLNGVMMVYASCLVIWFLLYVVGGFQIIFDYNPQNIIELLSDTMWLIIACISFIMGYYAMNQPEILRVIEDEENIKTLKEIQTATIVDQEKTSQGLTEEQQVLKDKLTLEMVENKLYTNSRLTLPELATYLKTSTHDISKVINEGYDKNFYDFINSYRVKAFIIEVEEDVRQELTYLGHAYNVGFNSKTAFNRAFKKETEKTPTQYFSSLKTI